MFYTTAPDDAILSSIGEVMKKKLTEYTGFMGGKSKVRRTIEDYFQVYLALLYNVFEIRIIYGHSIMTERT